MKGAYYNEIDPVAAQWLRNLIAAGLIAPGDVDERDIRAVPAAELGRYAQVHLFAGIGGWSLALRLAGWPDEQPVWTGSCPCQPLSSAGQRRGAADERHLWPAFYRLIAECRPATVFGEQVAGALGREWLAGVRADLEHAGYAVGAADLCAAGAGAPHIRQRLYWMADAAEPGRSGGARRVDHQDWRPSPESRRLCDAGRLGDAEGFGRRLSARPARHCVPESVRAGQAGRMGDHGGAGPSRRTGERGDRGTECPAAERAGEDVHGFWTDRDWIACRDGKWRAVESGSFPLADGIPGRVGRLRAYGNAIVPPLAAFFIVAAAGIMREAG